MKSSVDGWKQGAQGMKTTTGSEEKKVAEVGVVEVTAASVDPGAVVVERHDASSAVLAVPHP